MKVIKQLEKIEPTITAKSVIDRLDGYGGNNGLFAISYNCNGHTYFSILAPHNEKDFGMLGMGQRVGKGSCPWSGCRTTVAGVVESSICEGQTAHYFQTAQEFAQAILDNKWEFHD